VGGRELAAGLGAPISVPGVATLPFGGGGGGGVVGEDGPVWATCCATAVPPSARAASPTSAI
ncbi:MAG: hypothetical protein JWM87_873, partial [Candidatus Eremiobacteraeota bacterium]|nr:hypothetical protein [Candidatus Eremiobacteraeota bacterium]